MKRFNFPFAWYNKFGTIPETYKEAMSYEEQILWLCKHQEDIEKNVTIDIEALRTEFENALESLDIEKQDKLIAGDNIEIDGNVISAFFGTNLTPDLTENLYFGDYNIGDEFPSVGLTFEGTSAIIINGVTKPTTFKIKGDYTIYEINPETNIIVEKDKALVSDNYASYTTQGNTDVAVQFAQIETYPPKLIQENSFEGNDVITTLSSDLDVTSGLPNIEEGLYYTGNHIVKEYNETLQSYVSLVPENTLFSYSRTYVTIEPIYYLSSPDDLRRFYIFDSVNQKWNLTNYGVDRQIDSSSTDVEIPTSKAVYDFVQSNGTEVKRLEGNVVLNSGYTMTGLTTGFYDTSEYRIYLHSQTAENELFSNELVYYDMNNNIFIGSLKTVYYESLAMDWAIAENGAVENTLSNSRSKIPTSQAVKTYVDSISSPITTFTQNVTLTDGTTPFTEGLYYTGNYKLININSNDIFPEDTLFFYNSTNNEFLKLTNTTFSSQIGSEYWRYLDYSNLWYKLEYKTTGTINSTSTSTQIPTADAVYTYVSGLPTSPITTFTENITLTTSTTPFSTGLYYTGSYTLKYNTTTIFGNNILFYYSGSDNKIIRINKAVSSVTSSEVFSDYWEWVQTQYIQAWQHRTKGIDVAISSTSTNSNIPTSLAVYNAIKNNVSGNGNSTSPVYTIWTGTETEYNALTPDSNTLYFIKE